MSLKENYFQFLLDIDKINLEGEEELFKILKNQEEPKDELVETIWKYLEKVYSLAITFVKDNYPSIAANGIEILSLLWDGDEKSISDRVETALTKLNPLSHLCLILENETYQIINNYLANTVLKEAKYFEIISSSKCCEHCDEQYSPGIHPINEFIERPPFHIDCRCLVIFYINEPEDHN